MNFQTGHILVVDDDLVNRELLCDLLEMEGHEVTQAADGTSTLTSVQANPPDIILLDIMMPPPDGYEVCRRLTSDPNTANIPVILVSALTTPEERSHGIQCGASDFLCKPIDITDTVLTVARSVHLKKLNERYLELLEKNRDLESQIASLNAELKVLDSKG